MVILLAGGQGSRAGFAVPKQMATLGGKPVLRWSLDAFTAHPAIAGGVLVANDDVMAALGSLPDGWISANPGAERQQSVANALAALTDRDDETPLLVHDAARPGVTIEVIDRLLAALDVDGRRATRPPLGRGGGNGAGRRAPPQTDICRGYGDPERLAEDRDNDTHRGRHGL